MEFEPSFIAEQLYDTPTILRVTDTSNNIENTLETEDGYFTIITENGDTIITESDDVVINDRKVYLRKDDGEYLVPSGTNTDYVEIPITQDYVDIDVLDKDYALEVEVVFSDNGTQLMTETDLILITESDIPIIAE